MGALLIINYDVTDPIGIAGYREKAAPILGGPDKGARVAISSETVDLGEGTVAGATTIVLRFESMERALELWNSPEYRAVIDERLRAIDPKIALLVPTFD